jgi:hypothetical protein
VFGPFAHLAVCLLLLGGALLWKGFTQFRRVRLIQDTARSKAASAPQGHAEFQGVAWPADGSALVAPSGFEVVYHALKLQREETRGAGKSRRKEWVTVFTREHAPPFFLVDATGLVRIDPRKAELDLLSDRKTAWRSLTPTEREGVLAAIGGEAIAGFPPSEALFGLFAWRFRVVESAIRVGSPVYAHGDFRTTASSREMVRAVGLAPFHARVFDAARRDSKPLEQLLDGDGDGIVSAGEAIEGLARLAASLREESRTPAAAETDFPVHGQLATSDNHALFVADRGEEHLTDGVAWSVHLRIAGGLVAVAAAIVLLTAILSADPLREIAKLSAAKPESAKPSATKPASAIAAAPGSLGRDALQRRCLRREAAACDELLRRAEEFHLSVSTRRSYARQACQLGLRQHCIGG